MSARKWSWTKWICEKLGLRLRKRKARHRPTPRRQLQVEALEDRCVPAVNIMVTGLTDGTVMPPTMIDATHYTNPTLRGAIAQANNDALLGNPGDIITFAPGLPAQAIDLSTSQGGQGTLTLSGSMSIIGPNNNPITIEGGSSQNSSNAQVFVVNSGVTATLANLDIVNGYTNSNGGGIENSGTLTVMNSNVTGNVANLGGGIYEHGGTLAVTNSYIHGNSATFSSGGGGGIFETGGGSAIVSVTNSTISGNSATAGGGIYDLGNTLTVSNSTISGNSTSALGTGKGGGIYEKGGGSTNVSVTNSTISGNHAFIGGGIYNNSSTTSITGSTISGNSAATNGGGINNYEGKVTLTNSTIADNSASSGGGIGNNQTLTITNSTIASNTASSGAGIYNSGTATLINTLIADNSGTNLQGNPPATGSSHNLIQNGVGLTDVLAYNGGPTKTIALLPGSQAIGAGEATALTTDQRGVPRGPNVDIGAYQTPIDLLTSTVSVGNTGTVVSGSTIVVTVTAKDAAGNPLAGLGNSAVTIALSNGSATFTGIAPLTDNGDGTYSVTLTGVLAGTDTLTASIDGVAITSSTPTITVTPGAPTQLLVTTQPTTATAGQAIDSVPVQDAGFESPNVGTGGSSYTYRPSGTAWTFTSNAGVSGNDSGFTNGNPNAPAGTQVGFLQSLSGISGTISQSVNFAAAGQYSISFEAAQRGNNQQTINVLVDGSVVGTIMPSGAAYGQYTTANFAVTAGMHTIAFQGTSTSGDNTAFIDSVSVNASLGNGGVQVTLEDAAGNAIAGKNIGVVLNGGSFVSGNTTEMTNANGVAAFNDLVIGTAGSYTLTFSDSADSLSQDSNSFSVNPGAPTQFLFTAQPTPTTAGRAINGTTGGVQVTLEDAFGNTIVNANIGVALNGGSFASGSTTTEMTDTNGVATFNNLVIDTAGSYTLTFSANSVSGEVSSSFSVNPSTPTQLLFTAQPTTTTAGQVIDGTATIVPVQDPGFESPSVPGGYVYNPTGTAWTFINGAGVTGNDSGFTNSNPNAPEGTQVGFLQESGSASQTLDFGTGGTFDITFFAAQRGNTEPGGPQTVEVLVDGNVVGTITPSSSNYSPYATGDFTVTAGMHTITFQGTNTSGDTTAFIDSVSVNASLGVHVKLEDAFGNAVAGASISAMLNGGSFASGTTTQTTDANGVANFNDLVIDTAASGDTLTFTAGSVSSGPTSSFNVTAATPTQLVFTAQPTPTTAGQAIDGASGVQVTLEDAFGNTIANTSIGVALNGGSFASGTLTELTDTNGVATFNNLVVDTTGSYTLSFNDSADSVNSAPSSSFNVTVPTSTTGSAAAASFGTSNQDVTLNATVNSTGNVVGGSVTFAVYSDPSLTTQIGATTSPVAVNGGTASATFVLPGNTPSGTYYVVANYSGDSNFGASDDSALPTILIVSPAPLTYTAPSGPTNNLVLTVSGGMLQLTDNGTTNVVASQLLGNVSAVNITGGTPADTLTIDYTNGFSAVPINFIGTGGGALDIIGGSSTTSGIYDPSSTTTGSGTVTVNSGASFETITFSNLTPVNVSDIPSFTFQTPNSGNVLMVSTSLGSTTISGTSGGVGMESETFTNIGSFTLDTGTNDTSGAVDSIKVANDLDPTGLTNFTISSGAAAATLTMDTADYASGGDSIQMQSSLGGTESFIGDAALAGTAYTLTDNSVTSSADGGTINFGVPLSSISLTGGGGDNTFNVNGLTVPTSIDGGSSTSGNVIQDSESGSGSFVLTDTSLQTPVNAAITLANIQTANLTGTASGGNTFSVSSWTGTASLTGAAGSTYNVTLNGSGSGSTTINDTTGADQVTINGPTGTTETYTVTPIQTSINGDGETVNYASNVGNLTVNAGTNTDTFNVAPSTSTTDTINGTGGDALDINNFTGLTSASLALTSGLTAPYAGTWTFGGAEPVNFTGMETLTPNQITVWVAGNWVDSTNPGNPQFGDIVTAPAGETAPGAGTLIFGVNAFSTIQAGINGVVAGGTVYVLPGTYAENVNVDKSVTLLGAETGLDTNNRYSAFTNGGTGVGLKADPTVETVVTAPTVDPLGNSGAPFDDLFRVTADNVTIDGFVIDGNNPGLSQTGAVSISGINVDAQDGIDNINAAGSAIPISNLQITNDIIQNFGQFAIVLSGNATKPAVNNLVQGNVITNFGELGVIVFTNAYTDIENNTIVVPSVASGATGIQLQNFYDVTGSMTWSGNHITVGQNGDGIIANLFYSSSATLNIDSNTINAAPGVTPADLNWAIGVLSVQFGPTVSLSDNIIGNLAGSGEFDQGMDFWNLPSSTVSVSGGTIGHSLVGIELDDVDPIFGGGASATVSVSGTTISGATDGVVVDAAYLTDTTYLLTNPNYGGNHVLGDVTLNLSNVTITGSTTGVVVDSTPNTGNFTAQAQLSGGTSIRGGTTGLDIDGSGASIVGKSLNDTTFSGQTGNYITLADGAMSGPQTLNASGVLFDGNGASNSATLAQFYAIEDKITDYLDDPTVGYVSLNTGSVYVTHMSETTLAGAIQRGVNAAVANDTVNVQAGLFQGNITVDKSLTLRGANAGVAGYATRSAETEVLTDGDQRFIFDVTASGVTIDGFYLEGYDPAAAPIATLGSGVTSNALYGVLAGTGTPTSPVSNVTFENSIVKDVFVAFRGDGPTSGAVTGSLITDDWFDSIGNFSVFGYAVYLRTNFYADITDNLMTQVWSGVLTLNFTQADTSAWTMSGNTISSYAAGLWYNLQYESATSLTVHDNQFSADPDAVANNVGILMSTVQGAVSPIFTDNTITGTDYGVIVVDAPTSNTITLGATNSIVDPLLVGVYFTDELSFNPIDSTPFTTVEASALNVNGLAITGALGTDIEVAGIAKAASLTVSNFSDSSGTTGILISGSTASATVTDSTISGNSTGIAVEGGGTLSLNSSTISGNSAATNGGGIYSSAGSSATLYDSTISGNSAGNDGGGIFNEGTLTLSSDTVAGNSAGNDGGGIYNGNTGTLTLTNTIIAGNTAAGVDPDISGPVVASSSYNLIGDGTGMTGISNGDANFNQVGVTGSDLSPIDPMLSALASNGGPTETMALQTGSPAIGAGIVGGPGTDQRGDARPINGNQWDIGAFQTPRTTTTDNDSTTTATFSDTSSQPVPVSAKVTAVDGSTVNDGTVTFTLESSGVPVAGATVTANVVIGVASASLPIPQSTPSGSYTLVESFEGTSDFSASNNGAGVGFAITGPSTAIGTMTTDNNSTTTASSSASSQLVTVSADVASDDFGGVVNEGAVTFTLYNSDNQIVSSVTAPVSNGAATTSLTIPANVTAGSYTLVDSFGGTNDYIASSNSPVIPFTIIPTVTDTHATDLAASATTVTITGVGFDTNPGNDSVVVEDTSTSTSITVTPTSASATSLTVPLTMPLNDIGTLTGGDQLTAVVSTNLQSSGTAVPVATIIPTVTDTSSTLVAANAGTLTISGVGFDTNASHDTVVVEDTNTSISTTVAPTTASATSLTVALTGIGTLTGGDQLTAVVTTDSQSSGTAVAVATVTPVVNVGSVVLLPSDTRLTIGGSGFDGNSLHDNVMLTDSDGNVIANTIDPATATANSLTLTLTGPLTGGTLSAVVTTNSSGSGTPVQVATVTPVVNTGSVDLLPSSTTLTITGSGFDAAAAHDSVTLTDSDGHVIANTIDPATATANALTLTLTGPLTGGTLSAVVTTNSIGSGTPVQVATVTPVVNTGNVDLLPSSTTLTITGSGFDAAAANDSVTLTDFDGDVIANTIDPATATANSLTLTLTGPLTGGALSAVVTTNSIGSGAPVQVATVTPVVNTGSVDLLPSSTTLTITGSGFDATAAHDSVTLTDSDGNVIANTIDPATATANSLTLTLTGPLTGGTLSAVVTTNSIGSGTPVQVATVTPVVNTGSVDLLPSSTSLTITGSGFDAAAAHDSVTLTDSDGDVIANTINAATASATSLTLTLTGPLTGGTLFAVVTTNSIGSGTPVQVATVTPVVNTGSVDLLPSSTSLTITGSGFDAAAAHDSVTLTDSDGDVIANTINAATASATSLTLTLTGPLTGGTLFAVVTTNSIGSGTPVQVATVTPVVTQNLSNSLLPSTTTLTITGTGFDADSAHDSVTLTDENGHVIANAINAGTATATSLTLTLTGPLTGGTLFAVVSTNSIGSGTPVQVATVTPVVTQNLSNSLLPSTTILTISGSGFDTTAAHDSVTLTDSDGHVVANTISTATANSLTLSLTGSLTGGTLFAVVTTNSIGSGSAVQVATVTPVVTPNTIGLPTNATSFTINGAGFDSIATNNTVVLSGGAVGTVTAATFNSLTVSLTTLPAAGEPLFATVTTDGVASANVQVATMGPPIVSFSNASLPANAPSIAIYGFGFDPTKFNNHVTLSSGSGFVSSVTLATPTSPAVLVVTITSAPTIGPLTAVVTTNGQSSGAGVEVASVTGPFVTPNPLLSLAANATTLTINGAGFDPAASNNSVLFSSGAVGIVTAATSSTLTVQLTSAPTAGVLSATVTTDGSTTGASTGIPVATVVPIVTAGTVTVPAKSGATFTINGFGFDPAGTNTVQLSSGATGNVIAASTTSLTVQLLSIPNVVGPLTAKVTTDGQTSVTPVQVAIVAPVVANGGPQAPNLPTLIIHGTDFDPTASNDTVALSSGATGVVTAASASSLTVRLTTPPTDGPLNAIVTVDGISSSSSSPAVEVAFIEPTIVTASTANLAANATTLIISGFGFDPTPLNNSVTLSSGAVGTVIGASTTSLTVMLTAQPATGVLTATVTTNGISSGAAVQVATVVPVVTSSTVSVAANAPSFTINGFGFDAIAVNNSVALSSGSGYVSAVNPNGETLTVMLTSPPTIGPLTAIVTTDTISSGTAVQVATVAPGVTANTSNLPANATTLIIKGAGFDPTPSHNVVTLSSGSGTVTAASANQLTVTFTTAPTAGSLNATVTTDGITSGAPVEVASVGPMLSVTPNIAAQAASVNTVTITGNSFDPIPANNSVVFSSGAVGIVTGATSTTLTVTFTTLPTTGPLTAIVSADGASSGPAVQVATVGAPIVTSSMVSQSLAASTLTINGFGFDTTAANNTVALSLGAVGVVSAATTTSLTVNLATGPTTGVLTAVVTTDGKGSGAPVQVATVTPGAASNATSIVSATNFSADVGETTVTLQAKDSLGNNETSGGLAVTFGFATGSAGGTFGTVTDNHNGTYTATFFSTVAGSDTITATIDGQAVTSTAALTVTPGTPSTAKSTVSVGTGTVASGGTIVVTVTARDADDNVIAGLGNSAVTIALSGGTATFTGLAPLQDNGDGTYSVTLTGVLAGSDTLTASISGNAITSSTPSILVTPGAASLATSTVSANGFSADVGETTVTLQAEDSFGNNETGGGLTVAFGLGTGSAGGTFSTVTDHHNGTYTATFSSTMAGSDTITATIGGVAVTSTAPVTVTPGAASTANSTVSASSFSADVGSTTVTLQAEDSFGNNETGGGLTVAFGLGTGSAGGTFSTVTDHHNGTYTATFSSTMAGSDTITATIGGVAVTSTAPVTVTPGAASTANSTVSASSFSADVGSTTVTLQAEDSFGNNETGGGLTVAFGLGTGSAGGTFSTVTDHHNGTYTATFSSTMAGSDTITATIGGVAVTSTAPVTVTPGAASTANSTVSASSFSADVGSTTVTLQAEDSFGNNETGGGLTVAFGLGTGSAGGTFSTVTDHHNGTYTATFSSTMAGSDTITATIGGVAVTSTAPVTVTPGAASTANSTVSASSFSADVGSTTVTLQAEDSFGNNETGGGLTVAFGLGTGSAGGTFSTVTDHHNGTYTATFSSTMAGSDTITATIGGVAVTSTAPVTVTPGAASTANSAVSANPSSITDGGTTTVTLQAKDSKGNNETSGGLTVVFGLRSGSAGGGFSAVTDNGNGTYTATFFSTAAGSDTITATIGGQTVTSTAPVTVAVPNPADVFAKLSGSGISEWNGSTWTQINTYNPILFASNSFGDAVAEFAYAGAGTPAGVWFWNGAAWSQISTQNASVLAISNTDTVVADFAGTGVSQWIFGTWSQIKAGLTGTTDASLLAIGKNDTIVGEFLGSGVWLFNGSSWSQISTVNASILIMSADTNTIVGEFAGQGVWQRNFSTKAWSQLSSVDASLLAIGSNGTVVGNFAGQGVWLYNGSKWSQIDTLNVTTLAINANSNTVIGSFSGQGVWQHPAAGSWSKINASDATILDNGSFTPTIAEFSAGVEEWNGNSWTIINPLNATLLATTASGDAVAEFAGQGVWFWNGAVWTQINITAATALAIESDTNTVVANITGTGVEQWKSGVWSPITAGLTGTTNASLLAIGNSDTIVGEFSGSGVWLYSGSSWSQIDTVNAAVLAISADTNTIVGSFTGHGVWQHPGSAGSWSQLNSADASLLAIGSNDTIVGNFAGMGVSLYNGTSWSQIDTLNATALAINANTNMVIGTFPGHGVWQLLATGTWAQINPNGASIID